MRIGTIKKYVELLNLHEKASISNQDKLDLEKLLFDKGKMKEFNYIKELQNKEELEDFIVNCIYG